VIGRQRAILNRAAFRLLERNRDEVVMELLEREVRHRVSVREAALNWLRAATRHLPV
jgi:hypothetical protein